MNRNAVTNHIPKTEVLTIGQVARICGVASRTVSKWFDSGQLTGFHIPSGRVDGLHRHRRVEVGTLATFMVQQGMDPTRLVGFTKGHRVLLVGVPSVIADSFCGGLGPHSVVRAPDWFAAGIEAQKVRPTVVVLSFSAGRGQSVTATARLREMYPKSLRIVGLACEDELECVGLVKSGLFDRVISEPFTDPAGLGVELAAWVLGKVAV